MPSSMVAVKPRVICWAVATGTTIRALTSSSPTARMATVTVTAVVIARIRLRARTGQAGHPRVLLVVADREEPGPADHGDGEHGRAEDAHDHQVRRTSW